MNKKLFIVMLLIGTTLGAQAQFGKLKGIVGGKKDADKTSEADTTEKKKSGGGGANIFTKAITKIATGAGGMMMKATGMISTTADLATTTPIIGFSNNLYPAELGTVTQAFMKGWKTGGDLVFIMFTKQGGMGFNKIDGTVTLDGKPFSYTSTGTYVAFSERSNAPRKVEITTTSGQKSEFTLVPYDKPFSIVSINGQKDNVSLDLTKDVTIEFDKAPVTESNLLHITLAMNQIGIKSFYDLPYIKSGKTLTIPAASFRNINILPAGKALYSFKNSYLSVGGEKIATTSNTTGTLPAMKYDVSFSDGKLINVTTEPTLNPGLTAKGSEKFANGEVDYSFFKPNAFLGRPLSQIKKMGVSSFAIRGTTYTEGKESKSSSSYSVGNTTYTTTTTSKLTATFPQVSNQVWDAALESLYKDFIAAAQQELGAPVLPLESVTGTEAYQAISAFAKDDENTTVEFSRAYKNSKVLSAFIPIAEGYGINSAHGKIMKQSGTNALMKFTFDLQIAIEKGKPVMVPKLAFELGGEANGPSAETKYCTGTIVGKGIRYPQGNIGAADIDVVIRKSDLLATFRKGLQEIKAKELANTDYKTVWDAQK